MGDQAEHPGDCAGIKVGAIGGYAQESQAASFECTLEPPQEPTDVLVRWIVIEYPVDQAAEPVIVHDGQDAEGAVIQFVGSDVTGEVREGLPMSMPVRAPGGRPGVPKRRFTGRRLSASLG